MLKLPYAGQSHQSTPGPTRPSRLVMVNVAIVPRLVDECHDEDKVQGDDSRTEPEDIWPPTSLVDDEVAQTRSQIGRGNIEHGPQPDLLCTFVVEEQVLQEGHGHGLTAGEEEGCQDSHRVVAFIRGRHHSTDRDSETAHSGPEEDGGAAPI